MEVRAPKPRFTQANHQSCIPVTQLTIKTSIPRTSQQHFLAYHKSSNSKHFLVSQNLIMQIGKTCLTSYRARGQNKDSNDANQQTTVDIIIARQTANNVFVLKSMDISINGLLGH